MISKDMIKKIRRVEIKSNKIVEELFSGQYHSMFKGNGMEFEDIREYYIGDDVRSIDWNVTARNDNVYVKKFKEERELNLFLLVDMSYSNNFGKKREKIAEIGATLAFSAVKNNDKVGAILFTDKVEKIIPSKKGKRHVLAVIENLLNFEPKGNGTKIEEALKYFTNFEKKKSIIFLISDFMDTGYEKKLKTLSLKHDVILIKVVEEGEKKLPKGAIFVFQDLETGEEIVVDNLSKERILNTDNKLLVKNIININTQEDFIKPLMLFFRRRMKK